MPEITFGMTLYRFIVGSIIVDLRNDPFDDGCNDAAVDVFFRLLDKFGVCWRNGRPAHHYQMTGQQDKLSAYVWHHESCKFSGRGFGGRCLTMAKDLHDMEAQSPAACVMHAEEFLCEVANEPGMSDVFQQIHEERHPEEVPDHIAPLNLAAIYSA